MDKKIAHLEFIQKVIERMSTNSFLIKGWSVALVSALFAVGAKDANPLFILLAYFPAIMLWVLDAFFLYQERLFKRLYDDVRLPDSSVEDFSMGRSKYKGTMETWGRAMFSRTLLIFHGCILGAILFVVFCLILVTYRKP